MSRGNSPTASCISEVRSELNNIVTGFGSRSRRAARFEKEEEERARSRATSRAASRAGSRAASVERVKKIETRRQDPIMRRLEDIDPFEILHSTPDQLAKQLGVHKGKGQLGDINCAIEDIRTKSRIEKDDRNEKIIKTGAFADVTKQIGNMKTDHIREKIFKRHGQGGFNDSDSDEDESVRSSIKSVKSSARRSSVIHHNDDSDDDLDDISPYDSISNAGVLKDRKTDFESSGDIAEDIVRSTMREYASSRHQFNKDVGVYSDSDDDDEVVVKPRKKKDFKIGGKSLAERKAEDPMDLTATRRRLLMPDPNDPLDPANIDKMLEQRMKVHFFRCFFTQFINTKERKRENGQASRESSRPSSRVSGTGEDWLAMAARAAQMSQELSRLDAAPIDQDKFDRVYNDVLEGSSAQSRSPPSDEVIV